MANTNRRPVENEPPGFAEAWVRLTNGQEVRFGGKKQNYAEFYRAGRQSMAHWIEPKPVTRPTPAQGSLEAWAFQIPHDHEKQPTGHIPETQA